MNPNTTIHYSLALSIKSLIQAKKLDGASGFLTVLLALVLSAPAVFAVGPDTWTGATDFNWATGGNWTAGTGGTAPPAAGDSLIFTSATGSGGTTLNNDLTAGQTILNMTFNSGSPAYTFTNNGITLTGNVTNNSTSLQTINFPLTASAAQTFSTTAGGGNLTLGGVYSGSGGITKVGSGLLTLTANGNSFSGALAVSGGTLSRSDIGGSALSTATLVVGNVGSANAVMKVLAGANITNYSLSIGGAASARGALYQSGGTMTIAFPTPNGTGSQNEPVVIGGPVASTSAGGVYGYYNLSGGTMNASSMTMHQGGNGGTRGYCAADVVGGTLNIANYIRLARTGNGGWNDDSVFNVLGGTVTCSNIIQGNNFALEALTVGGGAGVATVTTATNGFYEIEESAGNSGNNALASVGNLLPNGILTVGAVKATATSRNTSTFLNFNGGTLKATSPNLGVNFLAAPNITAVTVYSGGGTIDNNGTPITINNALTAPANTGVTGVTLATQGSGYIGAPVLEFTGGTLSPANKCATAIAIMTDDGTGNGTYKVGSILVTSPGSYSVAPTGLAINNGGASTAATLGSIQSAANTSGGMTFQGSGTTTVSGANTYTGSTTITNGTFFILSGSLSASSAVNVGGIGSTLGKVSGTIGGASSTINAGATLAPGNTNLAGGTVGTTTFSGNLTLANETNLFDLNATATTGNDQVVVSGNLTLDSSDVINVNPLIASVLDTGNNYVLFAVTGTTTMTTTPVLTGVDTAKYRILKVGNNVVLNYYGPPVPSVAPLVFNPASPVGAGQPVTVSATVSGGTTPYVNYNWQVSTDGGVTFNPLSGAANASSTVINTTGQAGTSYKYQLIVTDNAGVTNFPIASTLTVVTGVAPSVTANTVITVPAIIVGASATNSATISGTAPLALQWQYSTANDGSAPIVNIPGATNATLVITNAQVSNMGYYRLNGTNYFGSTNSSFVFLSVTVGGNVSMTDFGTTAPTPSTYDISQLVTNGNIGSPANLNYYSDSGGGQTFTTGNDPGGYYLNSLYVRMGSINGGSTGGRWTLQLYSLTNAYAGTATLIGTFVNSNTTPNIALNHWIQWQGIAVQLQPNTVYGYNIKDTGGFIQMGNSTNKPTYFTGGQSQGQLAVLPAAGGAGNFGNSTNFDGVFSVNLAPGGYPLILGLSTSVTNGSTVISGTPIAAGVSALGTNLSYYWQIDSVIQPAANLNTYTVDTTTLAPGGHTLNVLVSNDLSSVTSSTFSFSVTPAIIQSVSIAPANSATNPVYAGTQVTLSSFNVQGNGLTYYWQTDGGSGGAITNIPGANGTNYAFDTSAMAPGTYQYDLMVSNASGTVTSSQLTLNLAAASGPIVTSGAKFNPTVVIVGGSTTVTASFVGSQPMTYQWFFNNGGGAVAITDATNTTYVLTNAQTSNQGTYYLTAYNNPPGLGAQQSNSLSAYLNVVNAPQTNTIAATIADGGASPFVGSYDISQLTDSAIKPPTLNYFVNNSAPPGQIFTTGNTPPTNGIYPLNYFYFKHDATGSTSGFSTPQTYNVFVYRMLDGTNAQLLTKYVTTNSLAFTSGDWVRIGGLTNNLLPNTTYAVSLQENGGSFWRVACTVYASPGPNGQACLTPVLGGATSLSSPDPTFGLYYDAAFVAGMTPPTAPVELVPMTIAPSSVYPGQGPVVMTASFNGSLPIKYQWQVDTGSGYVNIAGATNTTYTIPIVALTNAGTYICQASNSLSAGTPTPSTAQTLTVNSTPSTLAANYAFSSYGGLGVVGSGTYWNALDSSSTNLTSNADDGSTPASFGIGITTATWFNGPTAGITLFSRFLLIQDNTLRNFTFNNLIPGVYNVVLYSGNAYHNSRTDFSIGGVTKGVTNNVDNAFVQGNNYVLFTNIVGSNSISGSWGRPAGSGSDAVFNGLQLQLAWPLSNPHMFIVYQPTNTTVPVGYPANVSVLAEGPAANGLPGPVFYQWYDSLNNSVSGATNSTYAPNTSTAYTETYHCVITNLTGLSITSDPATVTVFQPDTLVWLGSAGDTWDVGSTANWNDITTATTPTTYADPQVVRFDDSASNFNVSNAVTVAPSSVTVSNTANNYVFYGSSTISGIASLTKTGNGTLTISNNQAFTGGTIVNRGAVVLAKGGAAGSLNGTLTASPGTTISLVAGDALGYSGNHVTTVNLNGATMDNALNANNGYATTFNLTGGTMTSSGGGAYNIDAANGYSINSSATNVTSTISANIAMRSSGLTITTAAGTAPGGIDLSITGVITDVGGNTLAKSGSGTLSLSGINTFNGNLNINAGTLQIAGAGSLNSGNFTASILNNGALSYNSSATQTLGASMTGSGSLTINGNGTLRLNGVNAYGATTVNAGTLGGTGTVPGILNVNSGGTLAPGAGGIGTLTVSGSLTNHVGATNVFEVNGSTPANDKIITGSTVIYGGVLNIVPSGTFTNGQKFTLFSGAGATNAGNFSSIQGSPGSGQSFTFTNGILTVVATGPSGPGTITNSVSGSTLTLTWPVGQGWRLVSQTNNLSTGLNPNVAAWSEVSGVSDGNATITLDPSKPTVFYRLVYP